MKIRVGASVDQSMRTAFRPLVTSAVEARKQILGLFAGVPKEIVAAMGGAARAQGGTFRGATEEARKAFREQARLARETARAQIDEARRVEREKRALARAGEALDRQRARGMFEQFRAAEREAARSARRQQAEIDSFARRTSHRTTRFLMPNMPIASVARRAGAEILRGYGVDPTVSGAFQRNITLERLSQEASNSARLAGQNVAPSVIEQRVRDVSNRRGLSREDAAEGVFGFQKLTGDLGMGLSLLDKMAERAAATSTSVRDYAAAMGNVSNALGDIPDKEKTILEIMDAITVQGARGAVEVSDMATHMARVAAAASKFGGDRAHNIKMAGALVQMARAEGGAPSAAEASRSIVGFANTFQKSARLNEFEKITGKSAFVAGSGNTQLRGMDELIKDALTATGGDLNKMNKIFMDVIGARAVATLAKAFTGAGGGEKGLAAVDKKIGGFTDNATLSQSMLDELNAQRDNTTAAKVQRFQNVMDDTAKRVQEALLPALEKLAPSVIGLAETFGHIAKLGIENPGAAIVAAIVASIGRAGLESALRTVIDRMAVRALTGGVPGAAGGKAGGAALGMLGAATVGLGIGSALAATIYTEGTGAIDANERSMKKAGHELDEFRAAAADGKNVDPARRDKLFRKILDEREALKAMKARRASPLGNDFMDLGGQWDWLKSQVGLSNTDETIKTREGMLADKERLYEKLRATKYEPTGVDSVARYTAKDPSKTSLADMQAAFKKGGVAELEKIATLTSKQDTTAQQMLAESREQTNILNDIRAGLAGSGRDPSAPNPDEDAN